VQHARHEADKLISVQIAAMEAVPVEEIKQTPYVVLCTTSVGGHLSWFEVGGGRWFAKPVGVVALLPQYQLTRLG